MSLRTLNPLPELTTARVRLRAPTLEDAPALFALYGNPEIMRYVGHPPAVDVDEIRGKLTRDLAAIHRGEAARWVLTLHGEQHASGYVGLFHWSQNDRRAELGYVLARNLWGKALMKEVLPEVVRFGFKRMGLHRIDALVDTENLASIRVLERLGFQREGVMRESTYTNGRFSDTAVFGLLEHEASPSPTGDGPG